MVETKGVETSFIPKQTLSREFNRRSEPMGFFMLIAGAVLVIALLFFGGSWGYRIYSKGKIVSLEDTLQKQREKLQRESLVKFRLLDRQLARAEALLASHNTALPLFAFLEAQTLITVRYNSMNYSAGKLDIRGQARSYESIALQSIEFGKDPWVTNFIFSDLALDNVGNVSFSLKMDIDTELLSYVNNLAL